MVLSFCRPVGVVASRFSPVEAAAAFASSDEKWFLRTMEAWSGEAEF